MKEAQGKIEDESYFQARQESIPSIPIFSSKKERAQNVLICQMWQKKINWHQASRKRRPQRGRGEEEKRGDQWNPIQWLCLGEYERQGKPNWWEIGGGVTMTLPNADHLVWWNGNRYYYWGDRGSLFTSNPMREEEGGEASICERERQPPMYSEKWEGRKRGPSGSLPDSMTYEEAVYYYVGCQGHLLSSWPLSWLEEGNWLDSFFSPKSNVWCGETSLFPGGGSLPQETLPAYSLLSHLYSSFLSPSDLPGPVTIVLEWWWWWWWWKEGTGRRGKGAVGLFYVAVGERKPWRMTGSEGWWTLWWPCWLWANLWWRQSSELFKWPHPLMEIMKAAAGHPQLYPRLTLRKENVNQASLARRRKQYLSCQWWKPPTCQWQLK